VIAVDQDPLGHPATCRSPGGCPRAGYNPAALGFHACSEVLPWKFASSTASFSITSGAVLTAQGCTPESPGDPIIMWPELVPDTCSGHKPGNQAFSVNATGLIVLQSGQCLVPSRGNGSPVTGKCGSLAWDFSDGQLKTTVGGDSVCLGVLKPATSSVQVWARPLQSAKSKSRVAVALFNPSATTAGNATITWEQVGLTAGTVATVTNLWTKATTSSPTGYTVTNLGVEDLIMLLVEQGTGQAWA